MTTNTQGKPLYSDDHIIDNITNHPKGFAAAVWMRDYYEQRIDDLSAALAAAQAQVEEAERERDIAADDAIFQNNELIKAHAQLAAAQAQVEELRAELAAFNAVRNLDKRSATEATDAG